MVDICSHISETWGNNFQLYLLPKLMHAILSSEFNLALKGQAQRIACSLRTKF